MEVNDAAANDLLELQKIYDSMMDMILVDSDVVIYSFDYIVRRKVSINSTAMKSFHLVLELGFCITDNGHYSVRVDVCKTSIGFRFTGNHLNTDPRLSSTPYEDKNFSTDFNKFITFIENRVESSIEDLTDDNITYLSDMEIEDNDLMYANQQAQVALSVAAQKAMMKSIADQIDVEMIKELQALAGLNLPPTSNIVKIIP